MNQELIAIYSETGLVLDYDNTDAKKTYCNDNLLESFKAVKYKAILFFGFDDIIPEMSPSIAFVHNISYRFILSLTKSPDIEFTRAASPITEDDESEILENAPFAIGSEHINSVWIRNIWGQLSDVFAKEMAENKGTVEEYINLHSSKINVSGRIFFHLVENKDEKYPFAFLATYSTEKRLEKDSVTGAGKESLPALNNPNAAGSERESQSDSNQETSPEMSKGTKRNAVKPKNTNTSANKIDNKEAIIVKKSTKLPAKTSSIKVVHLPLRSALEEFKDQTELLLQLLSTVSSAADKSDFISELVESGELFSPLKFTAEDAYTFLKEIPLYEECKIMCRIPGWWKRKNNAIKLTITIGDKTPSKVGLDALLSYEPSMSLGDQNLSEEEIKELLLKTSGLSFIKGKWVEVDHDKLKATLEAYEQAKRKAGSGALTLADALRMSVTSKIDESLGINLNLNDKTTDVQISNGQWLNEIRYKLQNPQEMNNISAGKNFLGTLRHYQQTGLDWMVAMKTLGFGALLADDMGLGKTVQILALLEYFRTKGPFRTLLIIPASLIGNWEKEIVKFAPKLTYSILHAKNTSFNFEENDLIITTYGMATRIESLKEHKWDLLIIDEAQAVKNPGTKQTRAVKQIKANFRIAMTGTPIENRLSDLWSLFDFLNSGLLGNAKEFSDIIKEMQSAGSYTKIRNVVNPFILRRLKTDKSVISDLPDKIEIKEYAGLSKKQIVLYTGLINELREKLETAEGIERKGLVLASIMKFKQICNHPDQYLGQTEFDGSHSGKFEKLAELCETIREKRERVLVFTQFREMTEPLSDFLEGVFGRKGLVLHGGTPVKKRTELVEKLCGEEYVPYMVLSLKAGGVGLNLTGANHVIHFDRWWNPAVENQATDRAFRIGQTKNVMVHKFITTGSIEEKIDSMIEDKQKLAGDIVESSGENWITEMSTDDLMKLFTLSAK